MTEYENTIDITKKLKFVYKGVDVSRCLLFNIVTITYKLNNPYTVLRMIKNYVGILIRSINVKKLIEKYRKTKIVFSLRINRKDYNELIDSAKKNIDSEKILITNCFRFKLPAILITISFLYKKITILKEFGYNNLISVLYMVSVYIDIINQLDKAKINWTGKIYVPFNSAFLEENCITQYLRLKGVKTYHLCHGMHFHPYKYFFPLDYLNQYNIASEIVLAWGENFNKYSMVISREKTFIIEIAGNPKYLFKKIVLKNTFKKCVVFLARCIYDEGNLCLVKLLVDYKIKHPYVKISIKPHPHSDNLLTIQNLCDANNLEYIDIGISINELLKDNTFDFAIAYQTTTYYEAMYYGLICFRYAFKENEDYGDMEDRFVTITELENLIYKISKIDMMELTNTVTNLLVDNLGLGINRYKEIITRTI